MREGEEAGRPSVPGSTYIGILVERVVCSIETVVCMVCIGCVVFPFWFRFGSTSVPLRSVGSVSFFRFGSANGSISSAVSLAL